MKRQLSPAFSTRALLDQETIIDDFIYRFLERIIGVQNKSEATLDMTKWFEMFTFDLFGEMAFGESFHAVEKGTLLKHSQYTVLHDVDRYRRATFLARGYHEPPVFYNGA